MPSINHSPYTSVRIIPHKPRPLLGDNAAEGLGAPIPRKHDVPHLKEISALKRMIGGQHVIGAEAWGKLGVRVTAPPITDEMVNATHDMKRKGLVPHVVFDAGLGMDKLGTLLQQQHLGVGSIQFDRDFDLSKIKMSWATATRRPEWILFGASDNGLLPGSRLMTYRAQQMHLARCYPEFEEMSAGALASVVMITAVETGVKLLSNNPWAYASTKDAYSKGSSNRVCLGLFDSKGLKVVPHDDFFAFIDDGLAACRRLP